MKMFVSILLLVFWSVALFADDQEAPADPLGPPPVLARVVGISKKGSYIHVEHCVWRPVYETKVREVIEDGKKVEKVETIEHTVMERTRTPVKLRDGTIRDLNGKILTVAEFQKLAKPNMPVLLTNGGKGIDPYYANFYAEKLLVVTMDAPQGNSNVAPAPRLPASNK